jgi:hypothetical protein
MSAMLPDRPIGWSPDRYNVRVRGSSWTLALAALLLTSAATVTSCTFLVQFHDAPGGGCDGGFCGTDAAQTEDAEDEVVAAEAGVDAGDAGDAGKAPKDAGPDNSAACKQLASGYYCAGDGLHDYMGSPDDLVYCLDGGIGKVTFCDGGCLPLPAPFPDACNPCPGVPDGLYCGRDLAGFPTINADFLIQCQTGNTVQSVACAHGCDSDGTNSSCYP